MPLHRTETPVLLALPVNLPKIFDQVQVTTANHQKNFVALSKIHNAAAQVTETVKNGVDVQLSGEKAFEDVFIEMIIRILPVKKGASVVDRVVKFVAGYVKFIVEKERQAEDFNEEEETSASRFVLRLISHLLKGIEAKDKNVRFRVLQILQEIISSVHVVDGHICGLLLQPLIDRVHDKEATIRAQAVIALSELLRTEDDDSVEDEVMPVLLDAMEHDDAADVRKASLLHLPLSESTLPHIISRCRDIDTSVRKAVYASVLEKLESPKQLTIAQREKLVSSGVRDRDVSVSSAAEKLIGSWCDSCPEITDFVELFDFELLVDETDIRPNPAQQALVALFHSRKDVLDTVEFGDDFWRNITTARAFLARVFVEYCADAKAEEKIESSVPVLTALAFMISALYNDVMNVENAAQEDIAFGVEAESTNETEAADKRFILKQLMKLSLNLDYADEIGRRKMFQTIRQMISQEALPESLVPLCLDILRKLNNDEKDLIRIVVEVIHDLRDNDSDEDDVRGKSVDATFDQDLEGTPVPPRTPGRVRKPTHEMSEQERDRADAIDLRCLTLCIGMLERVNSSFEDNSTLEGIFGELIIPAVKRKEIPLREKGFVSLGLCCLIARRMALNSFQLFLQQYHPSPPSLKLRILQIVFDVMMTYESDFLGNSTVGGARVVEFLTKLFESADSCEIQTVLCKGLAKLMMSGMVTDENVLRSLVLAYVSPDTADNQEVRQCLSYFLPVYCYSSSENQGRMMKIFLSAFKEISDLHRELDEDEEMISPAQAALLLVDWTDPQRAQNVFGRATDHSIHIDLAFDIAKALLGKAFDNDERKTLCSLFSKLYLPHEVDDNKLRILKLFINTIRSRRPFKDTTSSSALTRFNKCLETTYEAQLSALTEDEYHNLEELEEVKEVFDVLETLEDEDEMPSKGSSRKRRSASVLSVSSLGADEDEYQGAPEPKPKPKGRGKTKKLRMSKSDDEASSGTPSAPTRSLPKRSARKAPIVIEPLPETDEDEVRTETAHSASEDEEPTPPPRPIKSRTTLRRFASKQKVVDGDDEELPDENAFVSGADATFEADDAEDDDDEVADLLGGLEV